jgi:hypothetical protein
VLDAEAEPELRTDTERPPEVPDTECDSRPDTDRRERDDCDERDDRDEPDGCDDPCEPAPPDEPRPPPVTPVAGEPTSPFAATTGARPHVSQYSSPPPTSSYDPSQPGRWHGWPA